MLARARSGWLSSTGNKARVRTVHVRSQWVDCDYSKTHRRDLWINDLGHAAAVVVVTGSGCVVRRVGPRSKRAPARTRRRSGCVEGPPAGLVGLDEVEHHADACGLEGGVATLVWRRTSTRSGCGGPRKHGAGPCTQYAGWGTSHPGFGRCKLHGGSNSSHAAAAAKAIAASSVVTYRLPARSTHATRSSRRSAAPPARSRISPPASVSWIRARSSGA